MIKIGIITNSESEIEFIEETQKLRDLKITGVHNSYVAKKEQYYVLDELLDTSEALYIDKVNEPVIETLKSFLRRSSHLFLQNPFVSSLSSIRQLASLQQEAGSIIQIYSPYMFHSELLKMNSRIETPMLLDMEVTISKNEKLEQALLEALLFLVGIEKSDFRKLEVFGFQSQKQALINLHIQFISGSIAQLKIIRSKVNSENSSIHIYQKESSPIKIEPNSTSDKKEKSEQNALKHFIKGINGKDSVLLSLNELYQALDALQEIKEKLKYPNIQI